jgi:hypothetical protein
MPLFAFGVASSNPLAVHCVEKACNRRVDPAKVRQHAASVCSVAERTIKYLRSEFLVMDFPHVLINSDFFVDHTDVLKSLSSLSQPNWVMGPLLEGHEFLAILFLD